MKIASTWLWFLIALSCFFVEARAGALDANLKEAVYTVGAAKIDITPDYRVLMNGYYIRTNESTGVLQRIYAKALAITIDGKSPVVLVSFDNCGLPRNLRGSLLNRLDQKGAQLRDLAICVTHTHSAPKLAGNLDNIFGQDIPAEQQSHIDRYTGEILNKLEEVVIAALRNRQPARLAWGKTSADFAINRRVRNGPVDHDLPVLKVTSRTGKTIAIVVNYACHCTTLSGGNTKIAGDWAGYAQEELERAYPGAVAMTLIGCGAECNPASNPTGDARGQIELAKKYGRKLADAVVALDSSGLDPLTGVLSCSSKGIRLPFAPLPTRQQWESIEKTNVTYPQVIYHARKNLARLNRGEQLPTHLPYFLQSWSFGDQLTMIFLSGEVVGDYSLRLKEEFDPNRLWVTSYANDVPCYIPSRRVWKQHGYEADFSMVYYDQPTRLAETVEDQIIGAAHEIVPLQFVATTHEKTVEEKKKLHIYLLMGQSNMQGRGTVEAQDRAANARVFVFTASNHWELAVEPVHESGSRAGVGPGLAFGKTAADWDPKINIGLVPCAVGGTLLRRWEKGGDLYANAVVRARVAMRDGGLAGILWHQGEQDSLLQADARTYHDRLTNMITNIRADLGQPELPFVVGQIGEFLYTQKKHQTVYARIVNDALARIPGDMPFTACVSASGLTDNGDEVHFDAKSEREFGKRFAAEMRKLRQPYDSPPPVKQ